jgi:hypothetical protein
MMHRLFRPEILSVLFSLSTPILSYGQPAGASSGERSSQDHTELGIADRTIVAATKSISVRGLGSQLADDQHVGLDNKGAGTDLYGTEAIPHLEHVIPQLPSEIQTSLKNDQQIAKCIEQTNNYYRDVYKAKAGRLDQAKTVQTIREHDQNCLRPFPPLSKSLRDANPEFGSVGILFSRSRNAFYCTATLVSNRLLVTARHCAYLPAGPTGVDAAVSEDASGYKINIPTDIAFYTIAKPSVQFGVASFVNEDGTVISPPTTLPSDNQANDVIFMKLKVEVAGISPANLALKRPVVGEPMMIPGFYARLAIVNGADLVANKPAGMQAVQWKSYMRYDPLSTCRVVRVGLRCIFNGCQTDPGWSGAPVFVGDGTDSGRLVIAGIVSGSLVENSDCRNELGDGNVAVYGVGSDIPNVAVVVSGN